MTKLTVTILLFAFVAFATANISNFDAHAMENLWDTWKQIYGKSYAPSEELERFAIFVENYLKAVSHNAVDKDIKLGLNQFSDLSPEEFKKFYLGGYKPTNKPAQRTEGFHVDYSVLNLPKEVDWRKRGAVTPVKNQQQCGSCWSFSTTGALEGLNFIKTGTLLSFSEEQLVDCIAGFNCTNGGDFTVAFNYTATNGIQTEADYPYVALTGNFSEPCRYNSSQALIVNSGWRNITNNSTAALKAAVTMQPVSVGIEADQNIFQGYQSGIIQGAGCGTALDHAVLVVGYTTINGTEVFIIKNSWDVTWGYEGYGYIATNETVNGGAGTCGILMAPAVPLA